MHKLTFNQKRVIIGIAGALFVLCCANYYLDWGILGTNAKGAIPASAIVLWASMAFSGLTVQEIREYRDNKQNKRMED